LHVGGTTALSGTVVVQDAAGNTYFEGDATNQTVRITNLSTTGDALFQESSSTALQVNNAQSQSVINIDTSGGTDSSANNLANNPSAETAPSSSDWILKGTAAIAQDSTVNYYGSNSLKITGAATNDGAFDKLNTTLTASTNYNLLFYVKSNNTTNATVQAGFSINASAESVLCTNSTVVTISGWTRYSCSFTTPASGITSSNAIFIKTTDATARTINVDGAYVQLSSSAASNYSEGNITLQGTIISPLIVQDTTNSSAAFSVQNASGGQVFAIDTTDTNLLNNPANPSFEVNTTGWALRNGASGTTTIARDTSQQKYGIASLKITADAHAGNGARYTLSSGSWVAGSYTVSFSLLNQGTAFATTPIVYFGNGTDNGCGATTPSTIPATTGWIRYAANCTFSGTTTSIIIAQNETIAHTFYIDAVQLETGSVATSYGLGAIALSGQITTPLQIKNTTNNNNALQLQDSSGNVLFNVDTQGDILGLGSTGTQALATTLNLATSSGATQTIWMGGASTGGAAAGTLVNIQGGTTASTAITLGTNGAGGITIDTGTTGQILMGAGTSNNAKTITIGATATKTSTNTIQIGINAAGADLVSMGGANASSTITIEGGTAAAAIQIGNGTTAHGIQIGAGVGAAGNAQVIAIGSGTTTTAGSKVTLQGSNVTTTNGNAGIIIGGGYSSSDTNLVPFTLDSTSTLTETGSTCSATVNGGAMYYNSNAGSNTIRACINGNWEDLMSTSGMGLLAFGVVANSGSNPGDLASLVTAQTTGPCKVYWASTTTVTVAPCVAYSGGRKVIVASTTLTLTTTTTNLYENVCLTGTNGAPALVGPATTATSATVMPTFNASNPILCLATLKNSSTVNGNFTGTAQGQIYDVRTFTDTLKEHSVAAAALGLGYIAQASASGVTTTTNTVGTAGQAGIVVASNGSTSSTNPNVIIATSGPAEVVATAGTTAQYVVVGGTTASFAATSTTTTYTMYAYLGMSRTTYAAGCTSAATCVGSLFTELTLR
jgi:hypothetical protein